MVRRIDNTWIVAVAVDHDGGSGKVGNCNMSSN